MLVQVQLGLPFKERYMKNKDQDIYDMTDGLCEAFEEYAKLEDQRGSCFTADAFRKAAYLTKGYVGRWEASKIEKK